MTGERKKKIECDEFKYVTALIIMQSIEERIEFLTQRTKKRKGEVKQSRILYKHTIRYTLLL